MLGNELQARGSEGLRQGSRAAWPEGANPALFLLSTSERLSGGRFSGGYKSRTRGSYVEEDYDKDIFKV